MIQLCLSQCMTSQWCNHSDHCCNHSDCFITIGHQQWPIVSSSFINPLDKNYKINSQLSNETRHIFNHINEYTFCILNWHVRYKQEHLVVCSLTMKHTRVVSTKCTPGFACLAFSGTTLVCFIVNEHTNKCSRYRNIHMVYLWFVLLGVIYIQGFNHNVLYIVWLEAWRGFEDQSVHEAHKPWVPSFSLCMVYHA